MVTIIIALPGTLSDTVYYRYKSRGREDVQVNCDKTNACVSARVIVPDYYVPPQSG